MSLATETLARQTPQNIDAEQAVLGAVILDPEVIHQVVDLVRPEEFYQESHRLIYETMLALEDTGTPIDMITLVEGLRQNGHLERAGGASYIAALADVVPTTAHTEHYARLVAEKALLRTLIQVSTRIRDLGYEAEADPNHLLNEAERLILDLAQAKGTASFASIKSILETALAHIEDVFKAQGQMLGQSTKFTELDRLLSGLWPQDLIILASRPSMGKTSLALSIALNVAKSETPVGFFSMEMSKEQLVQRLLAAEAKVDHKRLRTAQLEDEDWQKLTEAAERISTTPVFIDDTPALGTREIRARAKRLKAERGLGLIVIDYLQLMQSSRRTENRQQEIAEISRSLKGLAKELDVPVLALSQLSRAVEQRQEKRPIMSDLRESGCLTGETMVQLANGRRVAIRELAQEDLPVRIMALNEETWKLEPTLARKVWCSGSKPVYRLRTGLGREIRATANHKFRTIYGWKSLDQLEIGDHLALPRTWEGLKTSNASLTEAEVALIGHLLGDGCILPRHAVQYTTGDRELADIVAALATEVFGDAIAPRVERQQRWWQVFLSSTAHLTHGKRNPIARWMDDLGVWGYRAHEKRAPLRIFEQPPERIGKFLRHLWSTDGTLGVVGRQKPRPVVYYATSSSEMAFDVSHLLLRLGIISRISKVPQPGKGRNQWHVTITSQPNVTAFLKYIGVMEPQKDRVDAIWEYCQCRGHNPNKDVIPGAAWHLFVEPARKAVGLTQRQLQAAMDTSYCGSTLYKSNLSRKRASKVGKAVQSRELTLLSESDVVWDPVVSIEPEGVEEVYDIEVPLYHNFIAGDIVVHNSLEQDADVIMFIYREEYYHKDTEKKGIAEVIVAKQRNGPVGSVELAFLKDFACFVNLAWEF
ncbi:MAG: replicative DNA helicase [Bacillota bacterium]